MKSGFRCYIGQQFFGALGLADDLTLMAPTPYSLRKLLLICEEFGLEYDILYNGKKTKWCDGHANVTSVIIFCGAKLNWYSEIVHLWNTVLSNVSDLADKRKGFIAASNSVT